jgi:integrase/recombinase XerC
MTVVVGGSDGTWRLEGTWLDLEAANGFLAHLVARAFSPATVRSYAYDLLNFARFLEQRRLRLAEVVPADLFDWIAWQTQQQRVAAAGDRVGDGKVVPLRRGGGAAPTTVNRRVAAVRALFEHQVVVGARAENPVPAPRRGQGLRPKARGMLGHLGPGRPRGGGRLVRQSKRLPESLAGEEVAAFLADLRTHRDRAIVLAMVLGGLRVGEVRRLRLRDVDQGLRRLRVNGKGGRERLVPVDRAFFAELAAYLRLERPPGLATPECFVVLCGPTAGQAMTEAGLRSIFRHHRTTSGAARVRPHRLRHTYGTELAAAGIDLLVLRELMGHASPETTAAYVHLSAEHLAAEYAAARAALEPGAVTR